MQDYNVPRWGIFFFFSPACGNILHFVPRWRKYSFFSPPLAGVQGVEKRSVRFFEPPKMRLMT
jgi:hypothetical protein